MAQLEVSRKIYGPGPTKHSRVLLARPGRLYPEEYVLEVIGGDESLIVRPDAVEPVPPKLKQRKRFGTQAPAQPEPEAVTVVDLDQQPDDTSGDTDDVSALIKLDRDALVELAGQRGVAIDVSWTVEQIVGALVDVAAGDSTDGTDTADKGTDGGDTGDEGNPADDVDTAGAAEGAAPADGSAAKPRRNRRSSAAS